MTRLCLIGYGKMGRMIAELAPQQDCEVVSIVEPNSADYFSSITAEALANTDVCIDFSHPSVVLANIRQTIQLGKNLVVGTTGWNAHQEEIKALVQAHGTGFLQGANFSIGMNLFSRVLAYATQVFDKFDAYDSFGYEIHHRQKADSPSGTAIELANTMLSAGHHKSSAVFEKLDRRPEPGELHFASIRGGYVPGTHVVAFDSEADTIELTHRVRSRVGFAMGAILAAKWLKDKKGFFTFSEMISEIVC